MLWNIKEAVAKGVYGLLLLIDGAVYWFVGKLFALYSTLAAAEIVKDSTFSEISDRIYLFIGIVTLFILSISLLKAMVNPDELNKNTKKIAINFVTSLALLAFIPTIFDYAFDFQNAIFQENIIGKIFFDTTTENLDEDKATISREICSTSNNGNSVFLGEDEIFITAFQLEGNKMALTTLSAFLHEPQQSNSENVDLLESGSDIENECGTSWSDAKKYIVYTGNFEYISTFSENVINETPTLQYTPFISLLCGGFLVYILLSFCIDMGVRVVKIAFYKVMAPIPIIMRIMPSKAEQFNKWVKVVTATYIEVFVRLIIINLVVYLSSVLLDPTKTTIFAESGTGILGQVIIILGLFAFAKQAPKLVGDLLGLDAGSLSLGIREKLKNSGAFLAGGAIGAAGTSAVRNLTHAGAEGANRFKQDWNNGNRHRAILGLGGSILRGTGSVLAGGVSGLVRGGYNARSAGNVTDMRKAANQAAQTAINMRDERENYRATHGGNIAGVLRGHISDDLTNVTTWMGYNLLDQLQKTQKSIQEIADAEKAVNDKAKELLGKQKERRLSGGRSITVNGIGNFSRLADIKNAYEQMKSSGTYNNSAVTAAQLTDMEIKMKELEDELVRDVLTGIQYDSSSGTWSTDVSKVDGELKALITDYRTKANAGYSAIKNNLDKSNPDNLSALASMEAGIKDTSNIDDFISRGAAFDMLDGSKKGIKNTNSRVKEQINQQRQSQQNNSAS